MDLSKSDFSVSGVRFIDEYRLLCIVERTLVLWDFTVDGNNRVTFKLEPNIIPRNIHRSYELDDTQKHFRADPGEGIVVVDIRRYNGFDALVIPVSALETPEISGEEIKWDDWGHTVTKLKKRPDSRFFVFHTHVLFVEPSSSGPSAVVVYDFSLYSRGADDSTHEQWCEPDQVAPAIVNIDRPLLQPLAVIRSGKISIWKAEHGHYHYLPAENGIVVIPPKVRIPVVANYIRALIRFISQSDKNAGTAMWNQVRMK